MPVIPQAYPYYNKPPAFNARPGMPAKSYVYVAVASPGGALNTSTKIPANTADANPTQKVTPLKTFQINQQKESKNTAGTQIFYVGMPTFVPAWLRTQLLSLGLVS